MTIDSIKKRRGDLPITFPRVKPQDCIADYALSLVHRKQIKYTTKWEISRDCSSIQLINAKKDLRERELFLALSRSQAIYRRQRFDEKWKELAEKQATFKTMFKKFNKFVKENLEKRERAEKKIADEIELQESRSDNIEHMQEDYCYITNVKNAMEKKIKDHRMYEDYLLAVVKTSGCFKNLNELLYRYESLIETKTFLCKKQQTDLNALEHAQSNMMKLVEDKALTLVGLQNQLSSLEERYDLAYAKSLQWENTVSKIQDVCSCELSNINLVKRSIDHTYLEMCARRNKGPNLAASDHQSKLISIRKTLAVLATILSRSKLHST